MKQLNIKTPLVFSIVVTLLSALLITSHMVSGLYAKYSTTATGSSSARVAKISYHIYGQSSNHSVANTSTNDGAVFAVEESFTITNDGDVAFDYVLDLILKDAEDRDIAGYTLLVPDSDGASLTEVHVLNSNGSITEEYVPTGQFYCRRLENGMDIKTLSAMIGHISAETTLNIYSHITDTMQQQAAVRIDREIGGTDAQLPEFTQSMEPPKASEPAPTKATPEKEFEPYKGKIRKSGTGCVTMINDHLYEGRFTPRVNGKRISKNVYAKTREECEEKLAELIKTMKAEIAEMKKAANA